MVILFVSLVFVVAQFIVELIVVSFLVNVMPSIGTFLYTQKTIFVVIHTIITVVLLWFAGNCSDSYCLRKKEKLEKQ